MRSMPDLYVCNFEGIAALFGRVVGKRLNCASVHDETFAFAEIRVRKTWLLALCQEKIRETGISHRVRTCMQDALHCTAHTSCYTTGPRQSVGQLRIKLSDSSHDDQTRHD